MNEAYCTPWKEKEGKTRRMPRTNTFISRFRAAGKSAIYPAIERPPE